MVKYRGAVNNPGRVECTTTAQILADFGEFGPADSWVENPTTSGCGSLLMILQIFLGSEVT